MYSAKEDGFVCDWKLVSYSVANAGRRGVLDAFTTQLCVTKNPGVLSEKFGLVRDGQNFWTMKHRDGRNQKLKGGAPSSINLWQNYKTILCWCVQCKKAFTRTKGRQRRRVRNQRIMRHRSQNLWHWFRRSIPLLLSLIRIPMYIYPSITIVGSEAKLSRPWSVACREVEGEW